MTDNKEQTTLEDRKASDEKLFSPSTARNRDPIREVFLKHMPAAGKILEVGAGTGEHAVHIASALPKVDWYTGDPDSTSRNSIAAWIADAQLANLHGPHAIDVTQPAWPLEGKAPFDGVVSMNMIHIAPFDAARGLLAGAGRLLRSGGMLFLYGPFSRNGEHSAPSNRAFDESLKGRDPAWGVRDLEQEIAPLAQNHALHLETVVEMPANNLSVLFRKQ